MKRNLAHVFAYFYGTPWAIYPPKLAELERVLWRAARNEPIPTDALGRFKTSSNVQVEQISVTLVKEKPQSSSVQEPSMEPMRTDSGYSIIGNVAVIPITGTITPRPSLFEEWSGGSNHDTIGSATEAAVNDPKVESIVYDIDSPGGVVFGMLESAVKVLSAKKTKPTTAVANYCAASAAYWYASQAGEIVMAPSGQVGSIGVIMRHYDEVKLNETLGITDVVITNDSSPRKSEGYPQVPLTEEERKDLVSIANTYAAHFIRDVAKGRGIRPNTVEKDFGQGRMLLAEEALAVGMVDRVDTMESVLQNLNKAKGRGARRNVAAQMAKLGLPLS